MYQEILHCILDNLCRSGAVFFRPEQARRAADERVMDAVVPKSERYAGFDDDIPGSSYFSPAGGEDEPYYPPERHSSHVEIVAAASGTPELFVNSCWLTLETGRVYVLLRNTVHTEKHKKGSDYTIYWLSCLPEMLTLHRTSYSAAGKRYSQSACRLAVSAPMTRMLWECAAESQVDECRLFSLLVQCLDYAKCRGNTESDDKNFHASILSQIRMYIDENYFLPITLADLAEMAHWSTVHLCREFAGQYGISIHKYIISKRLDAAAEMLAAGVTPGKAAANAGFHDPRYFSKVFRSRTGMTPSEYSISGRGSR